MPGVVVAFSESLAAFIAFLAAFASVFFSAPSTLDLIVFNVGESSLSFVVASLAAFIAFREAPSFAPFAIVFVKDSVVLLIFLKSEIPSEVD